MRPHRRLPRPARRNAAALVLCAVAMIACATFTARDESMGLGRAPLPKALGQATGADVASASRGCITCHVGMDSYNMHENNLVLIGCADCHGGDPGAAWSGPLPPPPYGAEFQAVMRAAHVAPAFPDEWHGSRNPERSYALLNRERREFLRFVNPGDLRIAAETCGIAGCHQDITGRVLTSMMAHSAMVPGAGTYNNGVLPQKNYLLGEFYMPNGESATARMQPPPTAAERARGVVEKLMPVPRYNTSQPGNIFRAAERGIAGTRGLGTEARVDFAHIVLHKTRLNDPHLWFLGTNDFASEYRSSGCSACHVLYANDESAVGGPIAQHGNRGTTSRRNPDPMIRRDEPGHPIEHRFTTRIPSSQCLTCHNHQGNGAIENYAGLMWWDGETDGQKLYRADGSLKQGAELQDVHAQANKDARHTQFSSQHRFGWSFRKVYRQNFEGQLLDKNNQLIAWDDKDWASKAVHLADAHFAAGMHCIDCHTAQDVHGDGRLYGAMADAVEVYCTDCHGTITQRAKLITSNPAGGNDLGKATAAFGRPQFEWRNGTLYQRSKVEPDKEWAVPQVMFSVDRTHPGYNRRAAIAKTLEKGTDQWGDSKRDAACYAHAGDKMTCYTCHTSWAITCSGCHLPGKTNRRAESIHYWGEKTQVAVGYYSQGLRADSLILGINGVVQGNRISTVRSASAPIVTVENGNRAIVTHQQPTVASSGHSGHAFSPFVPHTVSARYGQGCTSCHVSAADDNNAALAMRFNLGAHATDFVGAFVHLATPAGIAAVRVTEGWEPQPVIGSDFHQLTRPDDHAAHLARDRVLAEMHQHASSNARSLQARGEYLFVADGPGGLRVFDIANIANKDVAQRIITAPFSPVGHDAHLPSTDAAAVVLPTTMPMDPIRVVDPANLEQPVHPLFGYAYLLDRVEGLIVVDVNTFVDGDPDNNFLTRAATFDAGGRLTGATGGLVVGHYLYVLLADRLAIVDIDQPTAPKLVRVVTQGLMGPRALDVQFRYAAITDRDGLKVFDVTDLENPVWVQQATVKLADARGIRLCRTYAYIAGGSEGLVIVDLHRPIAPRVVARFTADGAIDDATAVTTGLTNASLFAYVAGGKRGLQVVELWTPSRSQGTDGFSPQPTPRLVATMPTGAPAVALSTGLQRDRGVDESGNQIGVFGRLGSRPLNRQERDAMILRNGKVYRVTDEATGYTERR